MPQGYNTQNQDVPVYLVTGFLEAGKTQFIQETISSRNFDSGETTLLIVCEEGEEEIDPTKMRRSKLICGFLDGGKTKFIQETLEDRRFNAGERTLLLVCEEGEEEIDPTKMRRSRLICRTVEDEKDLTPELLAEWQRTLKPERVLVEYNGMWM